MKKSILTSLLIVAVFKLNAQLITSPSATIQINRNLNFTNSSSIMFNNQRTIQFFGTGNFGIGNNAGSTSTSGTGNIFIGDGAGQTSPSGDNNTYLGQIAGFNASGSGNLGIGSGALRISTASYTTAVGYYSAENSSGSNNSFIGNSSGRYNTATNVLAFGYQSGINNQGNNSVIIGYLAGENNKGDNNILVGPFAGQKSNTVGKNNIFMGELSGQNNGDGSTNIFLGPSSGISNTSGSNNYFSCYAAGYKNISGSSNLMIGYQSGFNNTYGSSNIFLGKYAGQTNTTENSNIFIGDNADIGAAGVTNSTAIGNNAKAAVSNALILGNTNNPGLIKIGIGTSAPTEKLHVYGSVRFENLPTDAPGGTAVKYVVMDDTGKLYKYTGTAPTRQGVVENSTIVNPSSFTENWTLKNDFLYNKNKKGIIVGEGISSLPKGYGMYVTDGILTEKVKVALKNTSDWADYVFDENYERLTLMEVDKFINKYKHLPNVPTSTEMVNSGNDLHKTDVKLLEKIEELTLYMIELKKENNKLKNTNSFILKELNTIKSKLK